MADKNKKSFFIEFNGAAMGLICKEKIAIFKGFN